MAEQNTFVEKTLLHLLDQKKYQSLRDILSTMNPADRKLIQVTIEDAAEADKMVTVLMGDKVEPRREYITAYADFNREDNFEARSETYEGHDAAL